MDNFEVKLDSLSLEEFRIQESKRYFPSGYEVPDIRISEKIFQENVSVGKTNPNNVSMGMLIFRDCVFNGKVDIPRYSKSYFYSCIFNGSIDFIYSEGILNNCNINSPINIQAPISEIDLSKFSFKKGVNISGSESVNISNLKFENSLDARLTFSNNIQTITLENLTGGICYFGGIGSTVSRMVKLKKIKPKEVSFQSVVFLGTSMIYGESEITEIRIENSSGQQAEFFICDSKVSSFKIKSSSIGEISLERCTIDTFLLKEYGSLNSKLSILECKNFKLITFDKLINRGFFLLSNVNLVQDGELKICNSDLGKIDFILCDFSKGKIDFKNSKLSEIFFSESSFPRIVLSDGGINYMQQQLFFGQLSVAAQKQGDSIKSQEYSSREVAAHFNRIELFSKDFFEKLGLFFNFLSSDFGRSWPRGVLFSIVAGLVFFVGMLLSTKQFEFGWPTFLPGIIPAYLKFMNPLRFFELTEIFKSTPFNDKIELNGLSYFFDFLGKIFVAYGYYQTIQAFRRHGRK